MLGRTHFLTLESSDKGTHSHGAKPYCAVFRSCQRFLVRFEATQISYKFVLICGAQSVWPLQAQVLDPSTQRRLRGNCPRVCPCVIILRFPFNCTFHENPVWSGFRRALRNKFPQNSESPSLILMVPLFQSHWRGVIVKMI